MKTGLVCPCGEHFRGASEDELVAIVQEHLEQSHPGMSYTREEILFIAF